MTRIPVRRALISVYDKAGLEDLARALHDSGAEIVSTGTTAKTIEQAGIPVTKVEDLTGFPEALDLRWTAQGWVEGRRDDTMTGVEGIFAVGGKSVVYAMAAGTFAAEAIDRYLARKANRSPSERPDPFGGSERRKLPNGYGGPTWHL